MLRIRLSRVGKKKQPSYRIVVADSRAPRDSAFLKIIGHYNPLTDPATLVVKEEDAVYWLQKGAQPSETAAKLLTRLGVMEKAGKEPFLHKAKGAPPKPRKKAAEAPEPAAAPPAEAEAKAAPSKPKKEAAETPEPPAAAAAEAPAAAEAIPAEGETQDQPDPTE